MTQLEEIVVGAVRAARDHAERAGNLHQFFEKLAGASPELLELSAGRDCDYHCPQMGEAYALWFHMRRVAQIYSLFSKFRGAFRSLEWERPWRMLDVGAGTGAGAMALTRWLQNEMVPQWPDAIERAQVTCMEPALPMLETGERIAAVSAEHLEQVIAQEWRAAELGPDTDIANLYHLILFSTTFDFVDDATGREMVEQIVEFVDDHLAPGGSVLALSPTVGYDGVASGPKVRFANQLFSTLGTRGYKEYRRLECPPLEQAKQDVVHEYRCDLFEEANRLAPQIQLYRRDPRTLTDSGHPVYREDVFYYGYFRPKG